MEKSGHNTGKVLLQQLRTATAMIRLLELMKNGSKFIPFRVDPFFIRELVCRKVNRKSQKNVSLVRNLLFVYYMYHVLLTLADSR